MITKTFDAYDLEMAMKQADRDYYTWEAYNIFVDDIFADTDWEFDAVALTCDFTEADAETILKEYSNIFDIDEFKDEGGDIDVDAVVEALNDYTIAYNTEDDLILYQNF